MKKSRRDILQSKGIAQHLARLCIDYTDFSVCIMQSGKLGTEMTRQV